MSVEATGSQKPIHSLVLDTGPLIKNDPPASVLLAKAEQLYILPSVVPEIRDAATRSRVETTLLPFVELRSPKPESVRVIQDFARRTGDLAVLSKPDIQVLALGYELELERNGGDWRLRKLPGQKGLNGKPPAKESKQAEDSSQPDDSTSPEQPVAEEQQPGEPDELDSAATEAESTEGGPRPLEASMGGLDIKDEPVDLVPGEKEDETVPEQVSDNDDGSDGWITPSNLKKQRAKDIGTTPTQPVQRTLQAAVLTSDFAMQNVALRMNLNLVAPSLTRITHLKNWVLRCHGCFHVTKEMSKQFCPSCGQPTLTRTSCSTDEHGHFRVHLKKNFQWNNRGNVYSIPKPAHGTANGRTPRGAAGKNGWGAHLILAEDQKEYARAADEQRRTRARDLMDEDYLPGILSGDRGNAGGKIRVGAGRNVNSRKKR